MRTWAKITLGVLGTGAAIGAGILVAGSSAVAAAPAAVVSVPVVAVGAAIGIAKKGKMHHSKAVSDALKAGSSAAGKIMAKHRWK